MMPKTRTDWSKDQIDILLQEYANTANRELAKIIGVTEPAVGAKAFKLGLKKSEEFMRVRSAIGFFPKGNAPHNKGKKMPDHVYAKCKGTMFKKGNIPPQTRHDGAIRLSLDKCGRVYKYIRISKANWKLYSHYVWEPVNGPVPKGMCLWHKDGDTLNSNLDNLELITRKENRLRNSGSTTLSDRWVAFTIYSKKHPELKELINSMPELIELKRNQIKLRRSCRTQQ